MQNNKTNQEIIVVYGNHGKSPVQLEDYHGFLQEAFKNLGYKVYFSEDPVRGKLNILIEFFDSDFIKKIAEAKTNSQTKFIIIATEFITQNTFNDFEPDIKSPNQGNQGYRSSWDKIILKLYHFFCPLLIRIIVRETMPALFAKLKARHGKRFSNSYGSNPSVKTNWQNRFNQFLEATNFCNAIWCVSPHQLTEYKKKFGSKVSLMPLVSWAKPNESLENYNLKKDIDFLFTGSITPYRAEILDQLKSIGYNVVIGPTTWSSYLRDHYIARTKVCLQIRQAPSWPYPSNMRYHYLLHSGAVVVGELTAESCFQDNFIVTVKPGEFINTCVETIAAGNFTERGEKAQLDYYNQSEAGRNVFAELLAAASESSGNVPVKVGGRIGF